MHRSFAQFIACLGLCCLAGCQDPGCIRNSECKSGYECKDNHCQAPDAGVADGGTKQAGASGKGGSGGSGGSGGKGGQSGASAGAGGQPTAAAAPDAGSP